MSRRSLQDITVFLLFMCAVPCLHALDFAVRFKPYLAVPMGDSANFFTIGGGGDAVFDIDISSALSNPLGIGYSAGFEVGINAAPLFKADSLASLYFGGVNFSLFYLPFSRWNIRGEGTFGFYQGMFDGNTYANTFWRYGLEGGFRISPNFIINMNGGYRVYNYKPSNPNWEGLYAGLSAQITFETGRRDDGVGISLSQSEPIFPVFSGLYRTNQIGTLKIINNETAEIRNVRVSFRAGNYTSSELLCGTVSRINKRRSAELPLLADLSRAVYNFAENSRFPGEVLIQYELLGSSRTARAEAVVEIFNRNSFRWGDPNALSVFVSPGSLEVQDYQKYIVGIARNYLRTGLNRNMQFAMYLFEGLRVSGIQDSLDTQNPYRDFHRIPEEIDSIQFPFQTLAYKSGDIDDLGLLYASCLEAAGINSALIPLNDDFVVAFSLGIDEEETASLFDSPDNLLVVGGEVWMPVSFSAFREGFINCWYNAVNGINRAIAAEEDVNFIALADAWVNYPPAAVSSGEESLAKPSEEMVARTVETDMQRYIVAEFGPKIQAVFSDIQTNGPSAARYNQLGLLYVRSGMYAEAKQVYERSAAMNGNAVALVNLGNLAMIERDLDEADHWFREALKSDPGNRSALGGLEQIALDRME
ncbi:MAG: hypothetical protein LBK83_11430 [Treponema sp.]|jgi:tetratricopeptide (TPR) repeat protein|nr:hypothetical protein [Treponema sp.]